MKLLEIYNQLDAVASFNLCEQWDNSGIIIFGNDEINNVLITLDVTSEIIDEAIEKRCQLIISHHPIMFKPVKRLNSTDLAYKLVKNNISLICMHTNLDKALGGVNDVLCKKLGLHDIEVFAEIGRRGMLDYTIPVMELAKIVSDSLKAVVKCSMPNVMVSNVVVIGGSAGDYWSLVAKEKADILVTGEASYHDVLDASNERIPIIVAGHYETENWVLYDLGKILRSKIQGVKWIVTEKSTNPFVYVQ